MMSGTNIKSDEGTLLAGIEIIAMAQKGKSRLECKQAFRRSVLAAARGILPELDNGRGLLFLILDDEDDYLAIPDVHKMLKEPQDPGDMPEDGSANALQIWTVKRQLFMRMTTAKECLFRSFCVLEHRRSV